MLLVIVMLESLITSKTRIRLLTKFFVNPKNIGYLRGLANEFNESTNSIRKELNNLSEAGYLEINNDKNKVTYSANTDHPLFATIRKIIHQYLGLESIVKMVLDRMGAVERILIIGDYAKGLDTGTIEVIIEGAKLNTDYIDQLSIKVEKEIKRKVQFLITTNYQGEGMVLYSMLEINKQSIL